MNTGSLAAALPTSRSLADFGQFNTGAVYTDQLLNIKDLRGVIIWDVRSKEEYTGENDRGNKFKGHIPGATHLEWLNLVDETTHLLKPAKELLSLLRDHGITKDKRIHSY